MWRIIILYLTIFYTHDFQAQAGVKRVKYPLQNNTFLYEQQNGKINYFTLDGLPAFNQSFDKLSSFDANGYAWAHAGGQLFIINVIKKELIHFPNELRFLIYDESESESVSFVSEISNKVYFPLKERFCLDQKGALIAPNGTVFNFNGKMGIQNEFQDYLSYTDTNSISEQRKEEIRIIHKYLKVKEKWVFEPGLYSEIEFITDFSNAEIYYLVKQNEKWGVVCSTGDVIIPCTYAKIEMINKEYDNEYQNYFLVENEKKGIISGDGSILIPCIYDDIIYEDERGNSTEFLNGFTVVLEDKRGSVLNNGTVMVPCKYEAIDVTYFNDNNYLYVESIPKVDKANLNCNFYPFKFYGIGINTDKTTDFYSPQGDYLNTLEINDTKDFLMFSDNGYISFYKNGKVGLIGKSACLKIEATKDDISYIQRTDEVLIYCIEYLENGDYKIELLDEDLRPYFQTKYVVTYVDRNLMIVNEYGNYGIADIDKSSRTELSWVLLPEFEAIDYLKGNNYRIKKNGKTGVINIAKGIILPIEFESVYVLGDYIFTAKENGKFSFYNYEGTKLSEQVFDSIWSTGRTFVLINNKWSIFDLNTMTILNEFQFDEIEEYRYDYLKVTNNGLQGLIKKRDLIEALSIKYKTIDYDINKSEYICTLPSGRKVRYDKHFKRKR